MAHTISGLHHVTATVDDAQQDLDFYIGLLGLRLVKKTVNFDNSGVYHFYYGNRTGAPGTIMTTFPYRNQGVRQGVKGTGQIVTTAFSVPSSAVDFWRDRLINAGLTCEESTIFEAPTLSFSDPSALALELIGVPSDDRTPWTTDEIDMTKGIRGLHSVTLSLQDPDPTIKLLSETLGFSVKQSEGNRIRLDVGQGGAGRTLDILHEPDRPSGKNGLGTVHHVALAIASDEAQADLRADLVAMGYQVTEIRDRKYFRSIYFRTPGGILIEVATTTPGFAVDEPEDALGRNLKLSAWDEPDRTMIEAALPEIGH